ncbi:MAG TPA: tRNA (cytidine(34)-2'-O)-methyltransferase [Candidatus Cybelea sp.]|nr:tRNA (cytidine(34)-2'-O)-methyltransferase [Candidatus Cybelea sp.]
MRLALFEPDIPPNVGTILRLAACVDVAVDVIEPCGFPFSDRDFRRAALDYLPYATIVRHDSWNAYLAGKDRGRLVLLTTKAELSYTRFAFRPDDTLLLGRETAGVPVAVHERADARVKIPMREGLRSLNVAIAAAMVLGEALRQTRDRTDMAAGVVQDRP